MTESDKSCIRAPFTIDWKRLSLRLRLEGAWRMIFGCTFHFRHEIYLKCPESQLPKIHGFNIYMERIGASDEPVAGGLWPRCSE